jgi:hypothetical protein
MSDVEIEKGADDNNGGSLSTPSPADQQHTPHKAINAPDWTLGMKIYHTAIPCFLAFLMCVFY